MKLLGRTIDIVPAIVPVDMSAAANAGDWVSLKHAAGVTVVFFKGAGTDGDDPALTFEQATDAASTGAKALTVSHEAKKEGTLTAVGTWTERDIDPADDGFTLADPAAQSQGLYVYHIDASDLDVSNDYAYVRVSVADVGTNAQVGCALYILDPLVQRAPASLPSAIA